MLSSFTRHFSAFLLDESGGLKLPHILLILFIIIIVWSVYDIKTTEFGSPQD